MSQLRDLVKNQKYDELWQLCCGFLDLDVEQFVKIQKQLLLEQIGLLSRSRLGRKVMRGYLPESIEEFRNNVPITTYADYCPELLEKDESALPAKPYHWIQTSGRSGEYPCKWVPVTEQFWNEASLNFGAILFFGTSNKKYDVQFKKELKFLHGASQLPCLTGWVAHRMAEDFNFVFYPPLDESEKLSFDDRVSKGVKTAMSEGMTGFFGLAGVLVAIGEKIRKGSGSRNSKQFLKSPRALSRLLKGKFKSKLAKRQMLPKDLWDLKVIASMGTDSIIYKERIKELWGRAPLDVYGNTETTVIAAQTWDYNHMVFFPNLNFLEFMPEEEHTKYIKDHSYKPRTVLLNEVKEGENYELIITNLHGGPMVRYRVGDMIKITALQNKKLGIKLPQMMFERRVDDLIDLGFMRLTERVLWQALENSGIPYTGWTARKEITGDRSSLHLYLEPATDSGVGEDEIANAVYEQIKKIDDGLYVYKELDYLEKLIDFKPVRVTLLPAGIFHEYKSRQQASGSSLAHLRPPHINPSEKTLSQLGVETSLKAGTQQDKVTSSKAS